MGKTDSDDMQPLTDKEMDIIEFISNLQIELEQEAVKKLEQAILEKYGEDGLAIFRVINSAHQHLAENGDPCLDCGSDPSDLSNQIDEAVKNDSEIDMIADLVIDDTNSITMSLDDVKKHIAQFKNQNIENISAIDVEAVCTRILEKGLEDGWLADEYFPEKNNDGQ